MEKMVIYKDLGGFKMTTHENYNARINNRRAVMDFSDFDSVEQIIEYNKKYSIKFKNADEIKAFMEWLRCLPTALTIDFYYIDCRRILADWLQETEGESNKFNDVQVWDRFRQLITREFFAMLRRAEK